MAVGLALLATLVTAGAARGDDRELLRDSVGQPYVFILLDTSGSMHWAPPCSQAQFDAGECSYLCPTGDCYTPLQSDDPSSKFYQAKAALYEVLKDVNDIHFGFATYNQDGLDVRAKHWLYRAADDGPVIPGWGPFPARGADDVFGFLWSCDNGGGGDNGVGCSGGQPANLANAWDLNRMRRLPKLGQSLSQTVTFYVAASSTTYRVQYQPKSGSYGAAVTAHVVIEKCKNASCSSRDPVAEKDVPFTLNGEFLSWDNQVDRTNPALGYFHQGLASDLEVSNTCSGWDPNSDDTSADPHSGYSARWPTDKSDSRGSFFYQGDVVPLDWKTDHRLDILKRLAPNTALSPSAAPDFRSSPYFADLPAKASDDYLHLKNEAARPLLASGSTPLGNSIRDFRTWWTGCPQGTCPKTTGWSTIAKVQDPDWSCRRKFLLVITDGDDTCGGADACSATASLFAQESVKTYVVAFGVANDPKNKLTCMAANGGSGKPIYPQNKDELVKALSDLFGQIREEASAFASAAVPSVQAEVADRIYLSSFTPLNGQSVWDGHLDAYLKPLPLTVDGKPDRARACPVSGNRSACHLWDAGEVILGQAADAATLASAAVPLSDSVLRLGMANDQRRVFYGKSGFGGLIPGKLRLFSEPPGDPKTDADWADLFAGLKIPTSDPAAARKRTEGILEQTLAIKSSSIEKADGTKIPIDYLLGDIFHSDPVLVDRPNDFGFYSANLEHNASATSCSDDTGYRCYADKHSTRRKMLAVGSDDGQLHFFEAGIWDPVKKKFSDGTGTELFSFIPRAQLPVVRDLAEGGGQIFGIDATPRLDDVFIDTRHSGTPSPAEREWRTVLIGGYREGGSRDGGGRMLDFVSGYYALDITQPDQLDINGDPIDKRIVPSCLTTGNTTVAGCGTLPFPALLWEFSDAIAGSQLDEDDTNHDGIADGNGYADLGQTWSVPTVGRIRVKEAGKVVTRYVAIFGGGMDADGKASPKRGNWLYMVDVETGQTIYKRQIVGAAPADPAALDVDLDGFLDTLYIGTTAGLLYKVDLRTIPDLQTVTLRKQLALPPLVADQQVQRVTDAAWEPFPIFTTMGRPIYFSPTVFFVSKLNRFALAFGTGDREDLWSITNQEGRFYLIVDDDFTAAMLSTGALPKDETKYEKIDAEAANGLASSDFVISPKAGNQRGWYITLDTEERVITQTFGLSGILIFSSFQPSVDTTSPGNGNGNGNGGNKSDPVCSRGGTSRIFVVLASNANSIMDVDGLPSRYRLVPSFVTSPYVEQGATKNASSGTPNSEVLDTVQKAILADLKKFFPPGTKFANYWISVSGIRSDTGYERYATIPVGIVERNWKEH
jgi:hypothetical protein